MTGYSGDIAIVGMAGIYPQADDTDMFWANILAGRDTVTEAPEAWLGNSDILEHGSEDLLKIYTNRGGFLGDLSRFNPGEFGTMPFSVEGGQPDQFLALRICHDALADSGYLPGRANHERTGVILGHSVHAHRANTNGVQQIWFHSQLRRLLAGLFPDLDGERLKQATDMLQDKLPRISADSVPGLVPNMMTGRITNRLDLMGPNYIIDAACSSSLIAVDLAAGELRAGRADMMLAGGVNTTTSPLVYSVFCSVGALSRQGRIRPFGEGADGTILGEGAGAIALKRLEDAVAADDRIYAVIKAVGQSSDGKSSGLMAPRLEGEVLAMRRAYETSGLDPATIGLLEAHGTGIPLGDRTEITALREVFGPRGGPVPRIPVGSVKSMIGHCIPAAGSAAIVKNALALTHRILPPTLCEHVSDDLGLSETPFYVSTEARPWIHSGTAPRRAAINAFGFGGINAHMVLEEAPVGREPDPTAAFLPRTAEAPPPGQVFVLAAADPAAMAEAAGGLGAAMAEAAPEDFARRARESWENAGAGPARLAVVAADAGDLAKKLQTAATHLAERGTQPLHTRNGLYYDPEPLEGKTAFLFPGEMAQYPGMMKDAVMAFPAVGAWFDLVASLVEDKREVKLQDVAFPPPSGLGPEAETLLETLLHKVDYGSEMVFAADQAVYGLLRGLGVTPDALLGHSTGENAAIVASGWFGMSRRQVGATISRMNDVFNEVNRSGAVPRGVLLTVAGIGRDEVDAALERHEGLHFTMDNCPNQAIVFGQAEQIAAMQKEVVDKGAVCTTLPISWGYHTGFVAPMAQGFAELFDGLPMAPGAIDIYSCATARPFPREQKAFHETAVAQYVSRVRFREAVENLYDDGCRRFVECGPNATLTAFVRDILPDKRILATSADNRRRGMVAQLRHVVAQLYASGMDLDRPALLDHRETEDNRRRAERREAQKKAPPLPSYLPFPEFNEDEQQALREILTGGQAPAAAPAPAPAAQPVAPTASDGGAAMQRHLSMMETFLAGQERIARLAFGAEAPARNRISVQELTPQFPLPLEFRAFLMQGAPSPGGMARHLAAPERADAAELAETAGDETWRHWSLGRLAVKRAARAYFAEHALELADSDILIAKSEAGAPRIRLPEHGMQLDGASIAHSGGMAVGAVAAPPWRIGVDYELPGRIRDAEEFLHTILGPDEAARIGTGPDRDIAVLLWSIKEAAAKTLGVGIQGRPQEFAITRFDAATGSARVANRGHSIDTCSGRVGEGICSFGYLRAT